MTDIFEETKVAEGFTVYWADFQDPPQWIMTGNAPDDVYADSPDDFSNYSIEEALLAKGLLQPEQCDSESGQFFAAVDSVEHAQKVGEYIQAAIDRCRKPKTSVWE